MPINHSHLNYLPIHSLTNHCIVLDLDETLVHSSTEMNKFKELNLTNDPKISDIKQRSYLISLNDKNQKFELWGITRPHLKEFLNFCFSYFRIVAVWSAGKAKYVEAIVDLIFRDIQPPHVVYNYDHCDFNDKNQIQKPLLKMISNEPGLSNYMSLDNTFAIDDRRHTFLVNPSNGVLIPEYDPQPSINHLRSDESSLLQLMMWFLRPEVMSCNDIRTLDKSKIFTTPLSEYYSRSQQFVPRPLTNYLDISRTPIPIPNNRPYPSSPKHPSRGSRPPSPSRGSRHPSPSRVSRPPSPSCVSRPPSPSRGSRAPSPSRVSQPPSPSRASRTNISDNSTYNVSTNIAYNDLTSLINNPTQIPIPNKIPNYLMVPTIGSLIRNSRR